MSSAPISFPPINRITPSGEVIEKDPVTVIYEKCQEQLKTTGAIGKKELDEWGFKSISPGAWLREAQKGDPFLIFYRTHIQGMSCAPVCVQIPNELDQQVTRLVQNVRIKGSSLESLSLGLFLINFISGKWKESMNLIDKALTLFQETEMKNITSLRNLIHFERLNSTNRGDSNYFTLLRDCTAVSFEKKILDEIPKFEWDLFMIEGLCGMQLQPSITTFYKESLPEVDKILRRQMIDLQSVFAAKSSTALSKKGQSHGMPKNSYTGLSSIGKVWDRDRERMLKIIQDMEKFNAFIFPRAKEIHEELYKKKRSTDKYKRNPDIQEQININYQQDSQKLTADRASINKYMETLDKIYKELSTVMKLFDRFIQDESLFSCLISLPWRCLDVSKGTLSLWITTLEESLKICNAVSKKNREKYQECKEHADWETKIIRQLVDILKKSQKGFYPFEKFQKLFDLLKECRDRKKQATDAFHRACNRDSVEGIEAIKEVVTQQQTTLVNEAVIQETILLMMEDHQNTHIDLHQLSLISHLMDLWKESILSDSDDPSIQKCIDHQKKEGDVCMREWQKQLECLFNYCKEQSSIRSDALIDFVSLCVDVNEITHLYQESYHSLNKEINFSVMSQEELIAWEEFIDNGGMERFSIAYQIADAFSRVLMGKDQGLKMPCLQSVFEEKILIQKRSLESVRLKEKELKEEAALLKSVFNKKDPKQHRLQKYFPTPALNPDFSGASIKPFEPKKEGTTPKRIEAKKQQLVQNPSKKHHQDIDTSSVPLSPVEYSRQFSVSGLANLDGAVNSLLEDEFMDALKKVGTDRNDIKKFLCEYSAFFQHNGSGHILVSLPWGATCLMPQNHGPSKDHIRYGTFANMKKQLMVSGDKRRTNPHHEK